MARYQQPTDPRESSTGLGKKRTRRQRGDQREPIPWLWLGLGVVVSLIGIGLAIALATFFLSRDPLLIAPASPTIIRLTAPASPVPSATPPLPTPTQIPTFTPPPTPDVSVAPEEITIGYYVEVANTQGIGVILRGGPSTDNIRIDLIGEGTFLLVIGGPGDGSGFSWWQVQLDEETEGWVASDFLIPAAGPSSE